MIKDMQLWNSFGAFADLDSAKLVRLAWFALSEWQS